MTSDAIRSRTFGQWWDAHEEYVMVPVDAATSVGEAAYRAVGASDADAAYLFDFNLDKALQGDHARGIRLVRPIVEAARSGRMDLAAPIRVVSDWPASAVVDGGSRSSGRLVCRRAMELAVEKASTAGVGWVSARASGEILTPYVRQAVSVGMVGMALVQSVPNVAPLGGFGPLLGNGPMAVGVPAGDRDPVILDMSFTNSSASGVVLAAKEGRPVPSGLVLDERGEPTTDAAVFVHRGPAGEIRTGESPPRGTLTVLGGGHKGYAMVFIVGLLAAVLSGTSPPWELYYDLERRGTYGTVLLAFNPAVVGPPERFLSQVDCFIAGVKAAPVKDRGEPILYPGERSQQLRRERRASNTMAIPMHDYQTLSWLAEVGGMDPPPGRPLDEAAATLKPATGRAL